ncbi:MAG: hypothetical protein JXP34_28575, partial [Planctomycetes bacterium]|nr:hypothetical protein [Planctomycetota bacterium]
YDFPRDIQPILDRHCVQCHDADRREGGVELTGDHTPLHSVSYTTITLLGLVVDGRNLPLGNRAPRTLGSSVSRLMEYIEGSHHDVKLSDREKTIVRLWIETSGTYPGTYASLGCGMYPVFLPGGRLRARCGECHGSMVDDKRRGRIFQLRFGKTVNLNYLCNLSRPEKSIILRAPLAPAAGGLGLCDGEVFADASDEAYRAILDAIRAAADRLAREKRFDMPGFRPNEHYIREMQGFGVLPRDLRDDEPIDIYATDQAYWQSFWYVPGGWGAE